MNNIYRRQPIVHQLPSDYSDLDNIKYLNLNNIQGLQIYDNPIAAEQNSTYSCKNTYRDELGNLTVRPEIWYNTTKSNIQLDTLMHWYFDTQYGKKIYLQSETTFDTLNINTDTVFQRAIVKGSRVAVQETADATYILLQDNSTQALQFWKFDGETCEQCTGEIQIIDFSRPDLSLYNILNDKVLSRSYDLPNGPRNESLFVNTSEYNLNLDEYLNVVGCWLYGLYALKNGDYLIVCNNIICRVYYSNYQWHRYDYITDEYTHLGVDEQYCVIDDDSENDNIYINIMYKETASATKIQYKRFKLNIDADIVLETSCEVTMSNLFLFRPLHQGYFITIETANTDTTVELYKCEDDEADKIDSWESLIGITTGNKQSFKVISNNTIYAIIAPSYSANTYGVQGKSYNSDKSFSLDDTIGKYNTITSNSGFFEISSDKYAAIYDWANGAVYILSESPKLYNESSNIAGLDEISASEYAGNYSESQITGNILNLLVRKSTSVSIFQIDLEKNSKIQYTFDGVYDAAAMSSDSLNFVLKTVNTSEFNFYTRSVKPIDTSVDRPNDDYIAGASNIPVLSDFKENVITSFYLDGFYWFVTEHRVFGTGAANGVLTIEFFDPLKYFAFTETLTAAMRVSDTSFWLFHNAGAYLIYKASVTTDSGTEYRWMCTNTPKSKGCDFENAVVTLPVTSAVAVVTAEDICSVEMKENIQSDDRSLVPMTLSFRNNIRELLQYTSDIVIATYRYLTIFFLNKEIEDGTVPAVVFDSTIDSWWYWEFPADRIYQATQTETNVDLFFKISGNSAGIYNLAEDRFIHQIGSVQYEIYADRLYLYDDDAGWQVSPVQISWEWESAVLLFGTVDYRKQLLFTTFVFDDYHEPDNPLLDNSYVNFEFYFKIYSRKYATTSPQVTNSTVERVTNNACRTMVANYNYLQLVMRNRDFDMDSYEAMTKPKICSISMKYRILRGTLT